MPCKLCHRDEPRCNSGNLILCSCCFQRVANETQDQIRKAYELAVAKGYTAKAEVLKTFISEGIENDGLQINVRREPRYTSERFNRSRASKTDRIEKVAIGRLPEQEASPVSQD
jgi:hypothetical protein